MSNATLSKLSPAQWRVLLKLFYAHAGDSVGLHIGPVMKEQGAGLDDLIAMEANDLVAATIGPEGIPVRLPDLKGNISYRTLRISIMAAGMKLLVQTKFINVICALAGSPGGRLQARKLKADADANDATLIEMSEQLLVCVPGNNVQLTAFRRIPDDMRISLTVKGRQYYPR